MRVRTDLLGMDGEGGRKVLNNLVDNVVINTKVYLNGLDPLGHYSLRFASRIAALNL